jgi:hypothetical protein
MNQLGIQAEFRKRKNALQGASGIAFRALFFVFLLSTLFDPADKVFGLKVPLFLACWAFAGWFWLKDRSRRSVPTGLIAFVFLMVLIPVGSICYYFLVDGGEPYAGFLLLKSYLFISVAILIYVTRIDVIKYLAAALTVLALSILGLTAFVQVYPDLYLPTYLVGDQLGIFSIDQGRDYGDGTKFFQMYFVTSPMLVVPIAHYFHCLRSTERHKAFYVVLIALSACAMFVAGTRNNMIIAVLLPMALILFYSKYRFALACVGALGFSAILYAWRTEIGAMFDPSEASNSTKLVTLADYANIFDADTANLLFGSGLGAYEHWTGRGYYFVTELTFLENIRNFGVPMGAVMTLLLLYPVIYAFLLRPSYREKPIIIAYAAFLAMSMTNPLFFSSMGMLILAAVIAKISLYEATLRYRYSLLCNLAGESKPHKRLIQFGAPSIVKWS